MPDEVSVSVHDQKFTHAGGRLLPQGAFISDNGNLKGHYPRWSLTKKNVLINYWSSNRVIFLCLNHFHTQKQNDSIWYAVRRVVMVTAREPTPSWYFCKVQWYVPHITIKRHFRGSVGLLRRSSTGPSAAPLRENRTMINQSKFSHRLRLRLTSAAQRRSFISSPLTRQCHGKKAGETGNRARFSK